MIFPPGKAFWAVAEWFGGGLFYALGMSNA
jgi:hypothetical protein